MRVLVCGDRNWTDEDLIREELSLARFVSYIAGEEEQVCIHGAAPGADRLGGKVAKSLSFRVEAYPADWKRFGKRAGPIRNQQMLDEGKPTYVLAFHDDIVNSKGTKDMLMRIIKANIPYKVVSHG